MSDFDDMMRALGFRTGSALRTAHVNLDNMSRGAKEMYNTLIARMASGPALAGTCAICALMMQADDKVDHVEVEAAMNGIKEIPFFDKHSHQAVLKELQTQLGLVTDARNVMQQYRVAAYAKDKLPELSQRILALEVAGRIAAADGNFDDNEKTIAAFLMRELAITPEFSPPSLKSVAIRPGLPAPSAAPALPVPPAMSVTPTQLSPPVPSAPVAKAEEPASPPTSNRPLWR